MVGDIDGDHTNGLVLGWPDWKLVGDMLGLSTAAWGGELGMSDGISLGKSDGTSLGGVVMIVGAKLGKSDGTSLG